MGKNTNMNENNLDKEAVDNSYEDNLIEETDEEENYGYDDYDDDYDDEKVTPLNALHAVGEIVGEYKKAYDGASKKDKRTLLSIVLPLAITFVLGFIGVFLANTGQSLAFRTLEIVGFVFMGVGLGGFFLTIVILIIWSKTQGKK